MVDPLRAKAGPCPASCRASPEDRRSRNRPPWSPSLTQPWRHRKHRRRAGEAAPGRDDPRKLEVFDWLTEKKDKRVAKSPAGYLVKSISEDYAAPKGFTVQGRTRPAGRSRQTKQAESDGPPQAAGSPPGREEQADRRLPEIADA